MARRASKDPHPIPPFAIPPPALPIDAHLDRIVAAALATRQLLLMAPTGSGKTTRLPWALACALEDPGEIWVLEPRRIAARLAARHVAHKLGEKPGGRIGYEVRLDRKISARTRVRYLTEALLSRHLLGDPPLKGVAAVLFDEFHERHLHGDLALALLTRLQATSRPDLILGVLSATLEGIDLSELWPGVSEIRTEGRAFPVQVEHLPQEPSSRLSDLVVRATRQALNDGLTRQILCFLPGAASIGRCARALETLSAKQGLEIVRLHGAMSASAQDEALRPSRVPRIILSTNVAESSITVPGVEAVIDSGLARVPSFDPWSGLPRLRECKVSQASLTQRAGRAGRVAPGRCLRLFTEHDLRARAAHTEPEIRRSDLAELRLLLGALLPAGEALRWLTPPPKEAWVAAGQLLARLGLCSESGRLSRAGRQAATWAISPRLAAMLHHCIEQGVGARGAALAALLSERDILTRGPWQHDRTPAGAADRTLPTGPSDPIDRLERLEAAVRSGFRSEQTRRMEIDGKRTRQVVELAASLRRRVGIETEVWPPPPEGAAQTNPSLLRALLAGWPDRVAARRGLRSDRFVLADGGEVVATPASVVREAPLIVALEARREERGGRFPRLFQASAIDADWLIDLDPAGIREGIEVAWSDARDRVEAFSRMRFGQIVLVETRVPAESQPETAKLLAGRLREQGLKALADAPAVESLLARLELLASLDPEVEARQPDAEARLWIMIEQACQGAHRLAEVRDRAFAGVIEQQLEGAVRSRLRRWFPETIALPGRRRVPILYSRGALPRVASRLQDFFGLTETPTIAAGRLPLQLHLLAPNGRPVQITQDLPGFWSRHYPKIRKELRGRYPRHRWPEKP